MELSFGNIWERDLPEALMGRGIAAGFKNGFKLADSLTVLNFALRYPQKQLELSRSSLFYVGKELYTVYISHNILYPKTEIVRDLYLGRLRMPSEDRVDGSYLLSSSEFLVFM